MATIQRVVRHPNGEIEIQIPARDRDGMYMAAKRDQRQRHEAENEVKVATDVELLELARTGEYCIRMTNDKGGRSLIAPGGYEIVE